VLLNDGMNDLSRVSYETLFGTVRPVNPLKFAKTVTIEASSTTSAKIALANF
jgi:hypothetical protein